MKEIEVKVELVEGGFLPRYMSEGASGMDLASRIDFSLPPGEIKLIPTGIKVSLPPGFELQIRPRSGLSLKGVGIGNSPGTVDSDYRGEIKVILINWGKEILRFKKGDRIAQAIVSPVYRAKLKVVKKLDPTPRGEEGFGHTGED